MMIILDITFLTSSASAEQPLTHSCLTTGASNDPLVFTIMEKALLD